MLSGDTGGFVKRCLRRRVAASTYQESSLQCRAFEATHTPVEEQKECGTMSNQTAINTVSPPLSPMTTGSLTTIGGSTTNPALDIIAANDLISAATHAYAFLVALGLASACFLLYGFSQTYRAQQRRLAWLSWLLWAFCGLQLLLLLLSLPWVAVRPNSLVATRAGCATLSFAVNSASLASLLLLVLMAYVLTFDPPSHAALRRPRACAGLVAAVSAMPALLLAGLRGPRERLGVGEDCVLDPLGAGGFYAAARLCLDFLLPAAVLLGFLAGGCVRSRRADGGRFLSGSEEAPVFLTVAGVSLTCRLCYGAVLLTGVARAEAGRGSRRSALPGEKAYLAVAEMAMFSGSCLCLLLVLLVHRPCRESLWGALRQLKDVCCSLGGRPVHRHIVAPRIEIAEALEDREQYGA